MSFNSYAQNFEDVMLWRALGHVTDGFYIDVGAQHPVDDSVSKAFYDHGWRGIHVEATTAYAAALRADRPDEMVFQSALSDKGGTMTFYEIPDTGLSTGDAGIADHHRAKNFRVVETTVTCITLADVFAQLKGREVHWLKIDVEGMEQKVLSGWSSAKDRPWIVVVESTYPNSQVETHMQWEHLLLERGYAFAYYDGLSRFYVAKEHRELLEKLRLPPNVFDEFFFPLSATRCVAARTALQKLNEDVQAHVGQLGAQAQCRLDALEAEWQKKHSQLQVARDARQTQCDTLQAALAESTVRLEMTETQLLQIQSERREQEAAAATWMAVLRQQNEEGLQASARREGELLARLADEKLRSAADQAAALREYQQQVHDLELHQLKADAIFNLQLQASEAELGRLHLLLTSAKAQQAERSDAGRKHADALAGELARLNELMTLREAAHRDDREQLLRRAGGTEESLRDELLVAHSKMAQVLEARKIEGAELDRMRHELLASISDAATTQLHLQQRWHEERINGIALSHDLDLLRKEIHLARSSLSWCVRAVFRKLASAVKQPPALT